MTSNEMGQRNESGGFSIEEPVVPKTVSAELEVLRLRSTPEDATPEEVPTVRLEMSGMRPGFGGAAPSGPSCPTTSGCAPCPPIICIPPIGAGGMVGVELIRCSNGSAAAAAGCEVGVLAIEVGDGMLDTGCCAAIRFASWGGA